MPDSTENKNDAPLSIPGIPGRARVLCVCAHQDDEAFIAPRLRSHRMNGDPVRMVYTTLSYQKGEDYRITRMEECRKALGLLNIDLIEFLGHPDGKSWQFTTEITGSVAAVAEEFKPSVIYVPAYEGGHIDHDIANFCVSAACKDRNMMIYEFPLYSGYRRGLLPFKLRSFPPEPETSVLKLPGDTVNFMKDYWNCYSTQYFRFLIYVYLFSDFNHAFCFEYLRPLSMHNYLEPPVSGAAYERYLKAGFEDFRSGVRKVLAEYPG